MEGGIQENINFTANIDNVKKALYSVKSIMKGFHSGQGNLSRSLGISNPTLSNLKTATEYLRRMANYSARISVGVSGKLLSVTNLNQAKFGNSSLNAKQLMEKYATDKVMSRNELEALSQTLVVQNNQAKLAANNLRISKMQTSEWNKQVGILDKIKERVSMLGYYLIANTIINATRQFISVRTELNKAESVIGNILPQYGVEDLKQRTALAKQQVKELRQYSSSIGIDGMSAVVPYSQFLGSKLDGVTLKEQQKIAESFLKISSVYRLSGEAVNSTFLAISQMASKGTVSMEELRKQLANALPGSFQLAARSLGMTTKELEKAVRSGSVSATRMLKAMSDEIQRTYKDFKLPKDLNTALIQFADSFKKLQLSFTEGAYSGILRGIIVALTNFLKVLTVVLPTLTAIAALWLVVWGGGKLKLIFGATKAMMGFNASLAGTLALSKAIKSTGLFGGVDAGTLGAAWSGKGSFINPSNTALLNSTKLGMKGLAVYAAGDLGGNVLKSAGFNKTGDVVKGVTKAAGWGIMASSIGKWLLGAIGGLIGGYLGGPAGAIKGAAIGSKIGGWGLGLLAAGAGGIVGYKGYKNERENERTLAAANSAAASNSTIDLMIRTEKGTSIEFSNSYLTGNNNMPNINILRGNQI